MHMQALAGGGRLGDMLSHPSLSGISSGSASPVRRPGTVHSGSGIYLKGAKADGGEQPETICANSNSRKTSTAHRPKPSCSGISAACSCQKRGFPVSTRWRGAPELKRFSWTYFGGLRAKVAM